MNIVQRAGMVAAAALLALPAAASAQVYYYAPNTTSGAFNYGSSLSNYIPASAMPYVQFGQQMQQQYQQQYGGYNQHAYAQPYTYAMQYQYPMQYQSQSQYQNQTSYPSYNYGSTYPNYSYGYTGTPTYGNSYGYNGMNQYGMYSTQPRAYSYPSGTYGPFGTQLCYWSDFSTYEPCGKDPNQWVQDPYTGNWY